MLTVFTSQFLEPAKAFSEFHRVLRQGGYLGINEMYRADQVPPDAVEKVDYGEQVFRELTDLPFTLRSSSVWREAFEAAGFTDTVVEEYSNYPGQAESLSMIEEVGGLGRFLCILWKMLVLALKSGKIRRRYAKISKGKRVLLRDKVASRYIGYILCAGVKT